MEKAFDHTQYEEKIYKEWEDSGAFAPEINPKGEPYTIIMPPPNANDPLHVGHAMFVSVEDILIRYQRMQGKAALWLPGTDHAGIETQFVFEKKLAKDGKSRFNYDRETLYRMIWDYVQLNSGTSVEQMKRLGASADWSRFTFMLDDSVVDQALSTFEKLHQDSLLYRDLRLVNYCTKCGTGYSELEVEYEERKDPLYYLKYGPFVLATVRPETKFGDTAVAVHPEDERYQAWIGKEIDVQGVLGVFKVNVIADEYVDREFGTGVVKITPAHDMNDFEVGKRHNLEVKQVIGFDGKMMGAVGEYAGMRVEEARKLVVEKLQEKGLIERIDTNYVHNVGVCYRCKRLLEPLPMAQWFVKVTPLAQKALVSIDSGETRILGAGRDKILKQWLENLKDWNISRQIVWGIRIPVWYEVNAKLKVQNSQLPESNHMIEVGFLDKDGTFVKGKIGELLETYTFEDIEKGLQTLMAPKDCQYVVSRGKPGEGYLQETDTFDTWFSSGQWPVTTLKSRAGDFDKFYPTHVMETAYDILLFWVMRMMLLGIYLTGKSPFADVYLHGLVRDEKGIKMSKSKGNVINPIKLVDQYGADALRMALVMSTTPGQDSSVGENKVKGMRNFGNKIWNAGRFVKGLNEHIGGTKSPIHEDAEFIEKLNTVKAQVTEHLEKLRIGQAAETVHNEFWHWFCDIEIERAKNGELSPAVLEKGMKEFLKMLHPFMPFVTEVVWKELYEGMLIKERW